jgi:hypothetical protein
VLVQYNFYDNRLNINNYSDDKAQACVEADDAKLTVLAQVLGIQR